MPEILHGGRPSQLPKVSAIMERWTITSIFLSENMGIAGETAPRIMKTAGYRL